MFRIIMATSVIDTHLLYTITALYTSIMQLQIKFEVYK